MLHPSAAASVSGQGVLLEGISRTEDGKGGKGKGARQARQRPRKHSSLVAESHLRSLSDAVSAFTALDKLVSESLLAMVDGIVNRSLVRSRGRGDTRPCIDLRFLVCHSGAGIGSAAVWEPEQIRPCSASICSVDGEC